MAIPFVRALTQRVSLKAGVCTLVMYLCRDATRDPRLARFVDFRHRRGDMADYDVVAPAGMPDPPTTPAQFGRLVDEVEAPVKPHPDRERWPQGCAHLIAALPPPAEACLDECREIIHALVDRVRHGHTVLWMFVIHDLLLKRRDGHRHAHIAMTLREWLPGKTWSNRLRGLLGEVRHIDGPHGRFLGTVERVGWPDAARDAQILVFEECGLDGVVDPIAPVPQRHFTPEEWWGNPAVVDAELRENHERNRAALQGDAVKLVGTMLRGRASFPLREVEALCERYLDTETERRDLLDRVRTDPGLILLGPPAGGIVRITSRALLASIEEARDWVLDDPPGIAVVRGKDPAMTIRNLRRTCRDAFPAVAPEQGPARDFLIVDDHRSVAEKLALAIHDLGARQAKTVHDVLESPELPGAQTILVIPRLNGVRDAELAALLVRARHAGARVLAGFDESRPHGVVSFRFAAWIAQQVTPMVVDPRLTARAQAACLLRAGIIAPALDLLARDGLLKFGDEAEPSGGSAITVVDDVRLLPRPTRAEAKAAALDCREGDLIVFTATDFSQIPPTLRAKNCARVVGVDPERSTVTVALRDEERTIDLDKFAHLRSAEILSIGEARRAPADAAMNITMKLDRHAYACAALLATHHGAAELRISTDVAHDVASLARAIERNLAVPLLWELEPRSAPCAEANVALAQALESLAVPVHPEIAAPPDERRANDIAPTDPDDAGIEFEIPDVKFAPMAGHQIAPPILADHDPPQTVDPEPSRSVPLQTTCRPRSSRATIFARKPLPAPLSAQMRRAASSCTAARIGFEQLRERLASDGPEARQLAERIRGFAGEDAPISRLVAALSPRPKVRRRRNDWDEAEPADLLALAQSEMSEWDQYRLRLDLGLLGCTERFEMILSGPEVPDRQPDLPVPGL